MNSHTRYIQDTVQKTLASASVDSLPVPIEAIVEKMNLKIVEFDFANSISAVLKKERGVIGVNKNHHKVRRRFSIAHELGHFLLGHDIGKENDVLNNDIGGPDYKEREANMFASYILMPEDMTRAEVKKNGLNLKKIAEIFDVSEQVATIRLLELGLIK